MNPGFFMTPAEMIFLAVAVLVTLPFAWFVRLILRELRSETLPGPHTQRDFNADGAARKTAADVPQSPAP